MHPRQRTSSRPCDRSVLQSRVGPTHRMTRTTGIEIIEVRAGRIVRRWGEWDITAHTTR